MSTQHPYHNGSQQRALQVLLVLFGHEIDGLSPSQIAKAVQASPSAIIYVLPGSTAITAETVGKVSYSYGEQATIEALASAAVELELRFGGMNEALSGTPEVLDIFRAEAGLAKKLAVLSSKLDELEFDCEILSDTTRTGVGKSRFFAKHMAAVAAA